MLDASLFDIAAASVCNNIIGNTAAVFDEFEECQKIENPENLNVIENDPPP